ncbi:MAG: NAD(P)-dependent oxidoreductase [Actinomycetes bacterium]
MKIAIIGASGWLGSTISREAIDRGHDVTVIARNAARLTLLDGAHAVAADLDEPDSIVAAIDGSDIVVAAVTDRSTDDRTRIPDTARTLLELLPRAGVSRLAFVGGGGTLEVTPGVRAVDAPDFPQQYRNEALAQAEALDILRASHGVEWTYMSPPPHHLVPGDKTGRYRTAAGDSPVTNSEGQSTITSGDFASAFVDEIEQNRYARQRFTAGS